MISGSAFPFNFFQKIEAPASSFEIYFGTFDGEIKKVDSDGNLLQTYNAPASRVYSLAFDPINSYLYAGYIDGSIEKLDENLNSIWLAPVHSNLVAALSVDLNGDIYSAGDTSFRKTSSTSSNLWSLPTFSGASGIAADKFGNVYGGYGSALQKINASNGSVLWTDSLGGNSPQVSVDQNNFIYTSTVSDTAVRKHDDQETLIWSRTYSGAPRYSSPDTENNLYTGASLNLVKVDAISTSLIWSVPFQGNVIATEVDIDNSVIASDSFGNVKRVDSQSNIIWEISLAASDIKAIATSSGNYGAGFWT